MWESGGILCFLCLYCGTLFYIIVTILFKLNTKKDTPSFVFKVSFLSVKFPTSCSDADLGEWNVTETLYIMEKKCVLRIINTVMKLLICKSCHVFSQAACRAASFQMTIIVVYFILV